MPNLEITKLYDDGTTPTEQQLNGIPNSVELFVNITKLDEANIQDSAITEPLIAAEAITASKIASNAITLAKLASDTVALLMPTGIIKPYVGSSAPTGWLLCDGTAVSRATYSALYTLVADSHGEGDGSTTFNVPDYRGRFLRGADDGAGRDPDAASRTTMNTGGNTGDEVGTLQGQKTALPINTTTLVEAGGHTHTFTVDHGSGGGSNKFAYRSNQQSGSLTTGAAGTHTHTITGGGDNETRPTNAYVNFIIKT